VPSLPGSPTEAAPSSTVGRPTSTAWHTEKLAARRPAQTFLRWCTKTGRMPGLTLPPQVITQDQAPLHQHRRLAMLRQVLNDDSLPLRSRVVAASRQHLPACPTPTAEVPDDSSPADSQGSR
jgi:hypothetical protein